jgi:hypothetical protein
MYGGGIGGTGERTAGRSPAGGVGACAHGAGAVPAPSAARALEEFVAAGDVGLHEWVVYGTWEGAVGRMIDAVEAWSRHGPAGDNSMLVELDARRDLCRIGERTCSGC